MQFGASDTNEYHSEGLQVCKAWFTAYCMLMVGAFAVVVGWLVFVQ